MTQPKPSATTSEQLADQSTGASDVVVRSFDAMTGAIGSNIAAFALGEQTFAQATQAMVAETTKAITEIAAKEMVLNVARGTAALFTNPPAAALLARRRSTDLAAGAGASSSARPAEATGTGSTREPTSVGPRALDSGAKWYGRGRAVLRAGHRRRASTEDQVGQRVSRYQRAGAMRLSGRREDHLGDGRDLSIGRARALASTGRSRIHAAMVTPTTR